jgi:HEAT repeat protein
MMKSFYPLLVLPLILLAGCARNKGPLVTHGKPVSHWLEELKQQQPKARKKAVIALGHVGKANPAAMPAVIAALKDRDAGVRDAAVLALFNNGPDARDAIAALKEAANDRDPTVRSHALKALERIQGGS